MRVSVIVAVYKDVTSLSLIIQALKRQTYRNFEVIIAKMVKNKEEARFVCELGLNKHLCFHN